MKLKAMTYNICSGNNLQRDRNLAYAAEIINLVQPDFVTVNEVCKNTAYAPQHQADVLGSLTGYYPIFGRSIDIAGGEYGNAFLTRKPLLEQEVIDIPEEYRYPQQQSFIDLLKGKKDPWRPRLKDGVYLQHVLEALMTSAREEKWINI